ncbi:MAG: hypothetical protein R3C03_00645 [Pirellulaceae bacterium]
MDNGLIRRTFRMEPNLACSEFLDLVNDVSMLRAIRPEARVTIDGINFEIGGLVGQTNQAFLSPRNNRPAFGSTGRFSIRWVGDIGDQRRLEWDGDAIIRVKFNGRPRGFIWS